MSLSNKVRKIAKLVEAETSIKISIPNLKADAETILRKTLTPDELKKLQEAVIIGLKGHYADELEFALEKMR
jgi:hypothetical protein